MAASKGQLISKQNCRAITSPRESIFLQKEDRLSFCINLEVVNLEVKFQRLFFWRSYSSTILFRD